MIAKPLEKAPSGIAGLDEITRGGLPRYRPTLVCGGAGCGKTMLALQFLVRGALDHGEPGQDPASRKPNPDFVLNLPRYLGASVLLARKNFGCGSSREHAPWALDQFGFRAILAPSFADIFCNNSFKNGLLPITVAPDVLERLFAMLGADPAAQVTVDLEAQELRLPDGSVIGFEVDSFARRMILDGTDELGRLVRDVDRHISGFDVSAPMDVQMAHLAAVVWGHELLQLG